MWCGFRLCGTVWVLHNSHTSHLCRLPTLLLFHSSAHAPLECSEILHLTKQRSGRQ